MSEGAVSKVPHWSRPLSLAPAGLVSESGVHTVLEAHLIPAPVHTTLVPRVGRATRGSLNQGIQSGPEIEKGSSSLLMANPMSLWALLARMTEDGGDPRGHPAFQACPPGAIPITQPAYTGKRAQGC